MPEWLSGHWRGERTGVLTMHACALPPSLSFRGNSPAFSISGCCALRGPPPSFLGCYPSPQLWQPLSLPPRHSLWTTSCGPADLTYQEDKCLQTYPPSAHVGDLESPQPRAPGEAGSRECPGSTLSVPRCTSTPHLCLAPTLPTASVIHSIFPSPCSWVSVMNPQHRALPGLYPPHDSPSGQRLPPAHSPDPTALGKDLSAWPWHPGSGLLLTSHPPPSAPPPQIHVP